MKKSDRGKRKWYQQSYVMNEICWNVSSIIFAAAILNTSITNIIYTSCPDWYQHQKGYQILVHQSWRAEAVGTSLLPSYQRLTPHTFYTKVIYKEVAAKIATFEVINNFHRRRMTSLNTTLDHYNSKHPNYPFKHPPPEIWIQSWVGPRSMLDNRQPRQDISTQYHIKTSISRHPPISTHPSFHSSFHSSFRSSIHPSIHPSLLPPPLNYHYKSNCFITTYSYEDERCQNIYPDCLDTLDNTHKNQDHPSIHPNLKNSWQYQCYN